MKKKPIILASGSKKRTEILNACGIKHRVVVSRVKEEFGNGKSIKDLTIANACKKAYAVAQKVKKGVIIGADSLVMAGNEIVGKPKNRKEAKRFLQLFSGNTIAVHTALCVIDFSAGKLASGIEMSKLEVKALSDEEIEKYLKILKPYNKAGGFTIEGAGAIIFDDIRGSYFNILGLPLATLKELLKEINIDILDLIS